jgi:hypothetical protein
MGIKKGRVDLLELDIQIFERKQVKITPLQSKGWMTFLKPRRYDYFCLLCRVRSVAPVHPQLNQPLNFFRVLLTSVVFTMLSWNWLGFVGLFSIVPFWIVFELVYRIRLRTGFECKVCGFDPYLYLHDIQKAKAQVDARLRQTYALKGVPYPEKKINAALDLEQELLEKGSQELFQKEAESRE